MVRLVNSTPAVIGKKYHTRKCLYHQGEDVLLESLWAQKRGYRNDGVEESPTKLPIAVVKVGNHVAEEYFIRDLSTKEHAEGGNIY